MTSKRRIAIFTGNRAEYGLQYPILKAVDEHPGLDYFLLVSGAHLDKNFGLTLEEIHSDGFSIEAEIKIEMNPDLTISTAQAIGAGVLSISEVLRRIQPDIMVVYADRFEGFAAVIAASQMNIPTAHIEGGDLTEGGALDDSVRHAMTKLSHLHFTTNQQATNRLLAMGEEPWRVHTVGFPAIDLITAGMFASPQEISTRLGLDLSQPIVLFTQHPVTTEFVQAELQIRPSLQVIKRLATSGVQVIMTYPNNDAGSLAIIAELESFNGLGIAGVKLYPSLGRSLYHGILALAREPEGRIACLGNSSSGIKETPAFGCPAVNIGSRQKGRLRGDNVLDVDYDERSIMEAVLHCLNNDNFRAVCRDAENPYYHGNAGTKIATILAEVHLDQKLIRKAMTLQGKVINGWYR